MCTCCVLPSKHASVRAVAAAVAAAHQQHQHHKQAASPYAMPHTFPLTAPLTLVAPVVCQQTSACEPGRTCQRAAWLVGHSLQGSTNATSSSTEKGCLSDLLTDTSAFSTSLPRCSCCWPTASALLLSTVCCSRHRKDKDTQHQSGCMLAQLAPPGMNTDKVSRRLCQTRYSLISSLMISVSSHGSGRGESCTTDTTALLANKLLGVLQLITTEV